MTDDETRKQENVQIGYQVAAQLWAYEGRGIWSTFNAMVVANAIVVAAVVAAEGATGIFQKQELLGWILPLFGLLLSLLWRALVERGFTIHHYRVLSTRDLERHLSPVQSVACGAKVNDGGQVSFTFPGEVEPRTVRMSFIGGLLRGKQLALGVVTLFATFHLVVLYLVSADLNVCGLPK
jgi:hypothetical protein